MTWTTCQYCFSIVKYLKDVIIKHIFQKFSNYCILTFTRIQVVFLFMLLRQHFLFAFHLLFRPRVTKLMTNYLLSKVFFDTWLVFCYVFVDMTYYLLTLSHLIVIVFWLCIPCAHVYTDSYIAMFLHCCLAWCITWLHRIVVSKVFRFTAPLVTQQFFTASLGHKK
jgi:hypothetical protein